MVRCDYSRALCLLTLLLLVVHFCPSCMAQQDNNKENHIKSQPISPKPFQFNAAKKDGTHPKPASFLPLRPPILPFTLPQPQHRHQPQPQPQPQQSQVQLSSNHTFTPPLPPTATVLDRLRQVLQKAGGVYRDPTKDPSLNRTVIITGNNNKPYP